MYELISPVNFRLVLRYLGLLLVGIGAVTVVPFTIAFFFVEQTIALVYGIVGGLIIGTGYALYRFLPEGELQWKEAMVISALVFPVAALISSIPLRPRESARYSCSPARGSSGSGVSAS
jgi:trk system potassium uptake protein TrkH